MADLSDGQKVASTVSRKVGLSAASKAVRSAVQKVAKTAEPMAAAKADSTAVSRDADSAEVTAAVTADAKEPFEAAVTADWMVEN